MERLTYFIGGGECCQVKGADNWTCKEVCDNHKDCDVCPIDIAERRLAAYEDTGLEPEEIEKLKEKRKPKKVPDVAHFGRCPECDGEFNSELLNEYNIMFCPWCGQALDWED